MSILNAQKMYQIHVLENEFDKIMVPGNGLHFRVGCVPNLFIPDGHTISSVSFVYLKFSFYN